MLLVNNLVITIPQHKALGLGLRVIWYTGTLLAEAELLGEIKRLTARLSLADTAHAFAAQQQHTWHQNCSSGGSTATLRPRAHYCGLHGWNNTHDNPVCRVMARDPSLPASLRTATTHVGTGDNPPSFLLLLSSLLSHLTFVCLSLAASPYQVEPRSRSPMKTRASRPRLPQSEGTKT